MTMPEATIAEKPISGAARMRLQNEEADARAAAPPWTPTVPQQKPRPAAVEARLAEAAAMHAEGQALDAKAASLATQANLLNQKLSGLETERSKIGERLAVIERRNIAAEKAQATDTFMRLYGTPALPHNESMTLNNAVIFLATVGEVERLAPVLVKKLKGRVAEIDAEIAKLTK